MRILDIFLGQIESTADKDTQYYMSRIIIILFIG